MPTLHHEVRSGLGKQHDPRIVVPPASALAHHGPCVQVSIHIPRSLERAFNTRGVRIPDPISGYAMIDTGASLTCVDGAALRRLGAPKLGTANITTASHRLSPSEAFSIRLEIAGLNAEFDELRTASADLAPQGILLLIGRDILQHCTVFYNGPAGQITLSI